MIANEPTQTKPPAIIALSAWLRQIGRSDQTGWRWVRAGWLHPLNISGKNYLTESDIRQFTARAERGEFARDPHGVAARKTCEVAS